MVSGLREIIHLIVVAMKLGLIFKISVLLLALVIVIYGIQALRSPKVQTQLGDSNSVLGLLVGGDQRLFNWCPEKTQKIEIISDSGVVQKTLTTPQDISAVCELMIGGFTQESAEATAFIPKFKAYPESGEPVTLDINPQTHIFRVKGMPFSSPGLRKVLERLAIP